MSESGKGGGWVADCPLPTGRYDRIVLGHGSGGRLAAELTRDLFLPALGGEELRALEDQAIVPLEPDSASGVAVTTDAFVVKPLFFPGGDIGTLAVFGTVNDLAVGGAEPLYLTAAFILEEGLSLEELARVARSMRAACEQAGVTLVAADTKVVDRGKGDRLFVTTTGVGRAVHPRRLSIAAARPGDRVLVSGPIGDHGIAVMAVREGLELEGELASDCAPITALCRAVLEAAPETRVLRDPTRGGLASALNELAAASRVRVEIDERRVPVRPAVRGACELLGLDPLYVACEGRLVAVVPPGQADAALAALRSQPAGAAAESIGEVLTADASTGPIVSVRSKVGGTRVVPLLAGEQLPRIC